ncbi:sugar phosphate isomerase/epimerase family protein [Xanthobacteraceae bacterium Astr-EGSB]|uniref:sugar phosphate isomerase/epimerase family protein n=1 Tax=Astrobacterium formosum TaxID=3069710 RepID=UPI0027B2B8EF|nr:sugar phosphate isomerase/epimerase family protein [Xanthobacteraceae bacterium Astr-EGSB]
MRLSGFADEAASGIDGQIAVTKTLGWPCIEARSVDGVNIHDIPDAAFEEVRRKLDAAGIRINCFGSTIANWSKSVDEPFADTLATVARAISRMRTLEVPFVRIMSYAILRDAQGRALPDQKKEERFHRLREICGRFRDAGITPVHENCMNYGGMSWEHTLEMLAAVPGLALVYDTGNPGITPDFRKPFPYPNQDAFECYEKLRQHIVHVHIKDGVRDPATDEERYFFPDQGVCKVGETLQSLLASGYDGDFSIEPHMAVVFHHTEVSSSEQARIDNYVEYGRRFERMLVEARSRAGR